MSTVTPSPGAALAQRLSTQSAQTRALRHREHDLKAFESALESALENSQKKGRRELRSPSSEWKPPTQAAGSTASGPAHPEGVTCPLAPPWQAPMDAGPACRADEASRAGRKGMEAVAASMPPPTATRPACHGTQDDRWQFEVADSASPVFGINVQRLADGGLSVALQASLASTAHTSMAQPLQRLRQRLANQGARLESVKPQLSDDEPDPRNTRHG